MIGGFFQSGFAKIKTALTKARSLLSGKLSALFRGKIEEGTLEKLEQLLYEADFGVETAAEITDKIRGLHRSNPSFTASDYLDAIKKDLVAELKKYASDRPFADSGDPTVILIVGVNGNGKTTSVAKLARLFGKQGKKVLLGAADTFRAAASEQLEIWANRLDIDVVKGTAKSDPAAVTFDAVTAGKARGCDLILIDTAGRLHTKIPLMQELEKIKRSCVKAIGKPPRETLLVLDATTGQNAVDQARQFHKFTPLTGIILTKLDGTAKGGIVFAVQRESGLPVKWIGTGEGLDDLEPFDADSFVSGLFD